MQKVIRDSKGQIDPAASSAALRELGLTMDEAAMMVTGCLAETLKLGVRQDEQPAVLRSLREHLMRFPDSASALDYYRDTPQVPQGRAVLPGIAGSGPATEPLPASIVAELQRARRILQDEQRDGCRDRLLMGGITGCVRNFGSRVGDLPASREAFQPLMVFLSYLKH